MIRFDILCAFICVLNSDLVLSRSKGGCRFSLKRDIPKPTPIILSATESKILYPDTDGFLHLHKNEQFRLLCTGTKFEDKFIESDEILVSCRKGRMVQLDNRAVSLRKLQCHGYPKSATRQIGTGCYNNSETTILIEIGFQVPLTHSIWKAVKNFFTFTKDDGFIVQYKVCFDNATKNNVYSLYEKSMLGESGYQVNKERGTFREDYYHFRVTEYYHWRTEQLTLAEILNSTELASTYVRGDRVRYISRGHVTPRADFVYGFEQVATMYYVNAAPQWQQFNGGNWEKVERSVRKFLDGEDGLEYMIATGIHEQATLADQDGELKQLFLYKDAENNNATMIMVPKYFWKIVHHKTSKTGFGFVGINNPYLEEVPPETYKICDDICYTLDWITFDVSDVEKGYVFCCDMNELLDYLGIPDLFGKQ